MDLIEMLKGFLGGAPESDAQDATGANPTTGVPTALISAVLAMLKEHGLSNFVEMLRAKGLGNLVQSWVGTGPNDPVTGEEMAASFEPEQLDKLSRESGVPKEDLPAMLSQILPSLIDKLTPTGLIEEGSTLDQALDFVKARLGMPTT